MRSTRQNVVMMDPGTDPDVGDTIAVSAEWQAFADAVAALPPEVIPAGVAADLHDLVQLARQASDRGGPGTVERIQGYLALLRPRLTRLGDAAVASASDMPLRQVADLVHRIRVELTAAVQPETVAEPDDDEDPRGPQPG